MRRRPLKLDDKAYKAYRAFIGSLLPRRTRRKISRAVRKLPLWTSNPDARRCMIVPAFSRFIIDGSRLKVVIKEWMISIEPAIGFVFIKRGHQLAKLLLFGKFNLPMTVVVFPHYKPDYELICLPKEAKELHDCDPLRDEITLVP